MIIRRQVRTAQQFDRVADAQPFDRAIGQDGDLIARQIKNLAPHGAGLCQNHHPVAQRGHIRQTADRQGSTADPDNLSDTIRL